MEIEQQNFETNIDYDWESQRVSVHLIFHCEGCYQATICYDGMVLLNGYLDIIVLNSKSQFHLSLKRYYFFCLYSFSIICNCTTLKQLLPNIYSLSIIVFWTFISYFRFLHFCCIRCVMKCILLIWKSNLLSKSSKWMDTIYIYF